MLASGLNRRVTTSDMPLKEMTAGSLNCVGIGGPVATRGLQWFCEVPTKSILDVAAI